MAPRVSLVHPWGAFWSYSPLSPRPHGGIHIVCSQVKAQAASSWLCQQPYIRAWAAVISSETWNQRTGGSHSVRSLSQSAFHWWSMLGQWLFLALASVLLIRKHLLIIAGSFSLVLFKVQIALLCFLVMKLIDTHGENSNNADKCKVGEVRCPTPRDSTALALYILWESLPFKCGMSIIIPFYLKTLFLQKFSTSSTALSLMKPEWTWITIIRNIFEREEPKYILIKMWDLLPLTQIRLTCRIVFGEERFC